MSKKKRFRGKSMIAKTRAIITAAGESRRWKNFLGVPKHLAPVPGPTGTETLLRRQVRQLQALGVDDVVIVSPPGDLRYETEGAKLYPRAIVDEYGQADRFMTTELWNVDGRTLYLPGDLYATDEAMQTMVCETNRTWVWYMRLRRYEWHGIQRSRAIFGFGFWPENHAFFSMTVRYLNSLERDKQSPVKRSLGIDLYRAMAGEPEEVFSKTKGSKYFNEHPPHSVLIDDLTTDLDNPEQYANLTDLLSEGTAESQSSSPTSAHPSPDIRREEELSKTRVIITAAGTRGRHRWNNHLGRPKHFIQIPPGGETLLERTIRLVREAGVQDVMLVAPEIDPPLWTYEVPGASVYRKALPKEKEVHHRQADRYLPRALWNKDGRTLFIPGDYYFCRETLTQMLAYDPKTWVFYARLSNTRWPTGEPLAMNRTRMILGFSFPAHEHELVMQKIEEITAMQRDPSNPITRSLGLDIYRFMAGQTPEEVARRGGESGKAIWADYPPHIWQPSEDTADIDFDNPKTYGDFMLHYRPDLHD